MSLFLSHKFQRSRARSPFVASSVCGGIGKFGGISKVPPLLTGLVLDLLGDNISQADGSLVATWPDAPWSAGHNATQATAGLQPVLQKNALGSRAGVVFDAVADQMGTLLSLPNPFTIYLVALPMQSPSGHTRMVTATGGNSMLEFNRDDGYGVFNNGASGLPIASNPTGNGIGVLSVGAQSRFWKNGVETTTDTAQTGAWGAGGHLVLGGTEPAAGTVLRLLAYSVSHTPAQVLQMNTYLSAYYPGL